MAALPSPTQVAGTHSAIYEAYYHQVDPQGTGAIQALDAARFLKKSYLSDVVLSKIWDLSDPTGKGYLDKAGLFVALKLVALAQAGRDINMSNIHSDAPPPKVGEIPKITHGAPPARPAAPSPALAPLSDWSMKPAERDKYSQLFDSLQPTNGLIAGNKVKGVLMESKLPLETLGKIWDLADQDKDGMLDRHEFMVAMHLVYKALEKHAVPTTLPAELRRAARPPSQPPSRPPSRPPSPQPRPPPPRPTPPPASKPAPVSNASLLDGLLDLSSPPTQNAPSLISAPAPMGAPLLPSAPGPGAGVGAGSGAGGWVVTPAEKAQYDAQFHAADQDRDGFVSGAEIKHTFLESGLPQQTLAHIWALCDTESTGKLSRDQFALAMWLVRRAARGTPPPAALAPDMVPPSCRPQPPPQAQVSSEPALGLGPQPTPELEAIAREVDALARERLALDAELAARQRELAVKTGEADGLQNELDTLTATLKQLENQKGEAQKRLNDLKSQVEKLRSQVSAQEAAAAETEAEVAARRAAAHTLKERERALQQEAADAEAEADSLTALLRRTVLAVSQANIKIAHLEEQHRLITSATEALAAGGAAAGAAAALQPQFSAEHLDQLVRGCTPVAQEGDEPFSKSNEFGAMNGSAAFGDPFKDAAFDATPADPFAPAGRDPPAQGGFASDPFAPSSDPFAGDAFAPPDSKNKPNDDGAWEADPFAVLHAPTRASAGAGAGAGAGSGAGSGRWSPTPRLPPKAHKTPPPRPAPPRPNPPAKTRAAAMDFTEDPFKDYRYEDPFNIADPFADATDSRRPTTDVRPTSVAGFETDDFFSPASNLNGTFPAPEKRSGRVSAPPVASDPFSARPDPRPTDNDAWAAWPNDNWVADDAWTKTKSDWKTDNWASKTIATKPDDWADKSDNWATDWADHNKNLNETWPSTLPKKEKSPKPVKYARSLVHTIGGIGRTKHKEKKAKGLEARSVEALPSEEQQWAWAAAESRTEAAEAERRRQREEAELRLALARSLQEK